jgi:Regulator of Chromosome Condensation (RCC1) repeat protein
MPTSIPDGFRPRIGVLLLVAAVACSGDTAFETRLAPPSAIARLVITSGDGQTGNVGDPLPGDLAVRATDAAGHPMPLAQIAFEADAHSGSVLGDLPYSLTNSAGLATAQWRLGGMAGPDQTVRAHPYGVTGGPTVTFHAVARAGPLVSLRGLSPFQDSIPAGSSYSSPLKVLALDRFTNPVPDVLVQWNAAAGSGSLAADTSKTDASGIATDVWTINGPNDGAIAAGAYRATAGALDLVTVTFVRTAGDAQLVAAAIVAGGDHSCALDTAGQAWCWGDNQEGELGDGTTSERLFAVVVSGGHTFTSLASGAYHTCGIAGDGAAWCWGRNTSGEVGDGSAGDRLAPVAVSGGFHFTALAGGWSHTCGLTGQGTAYCWGRGSEGQLGYGGLTYHTTPVAVAAGESLTALSLGNEHTCGVTADKALFCWGDNTASQLGIPACAPQAQSPCSVNRSAVPMQVPGEYIGVVADGNHTCALEPNGSAVCWGDGVVDHLPVDQSAPFTSIAAGQGRICGLDRTGRALCWSFEQAACDYYGPCYPPSLSTPRDVFAPYRFLALAGGLGHGCGISNGLAQTRSTGALAECWGENDHGQVGDGSTSMRSLPVAVLRGATP